MPTGPCSHPVDAFGHTLAEVKLDILRLFGACSGEVVHSNMSSGGSFHGSSRGPPSLLRCQMLRSWL